MAPHLPDAEVNRYICLKASNPSQDIATVFIHYQHLSVQSERISPLLPSSMADAQTLYWRDVSSLEHCGEPWEAGNCSSGKIHLQYGWEWGKYTFVFCSFIIHRFGGKGVNFFSLVGCCAMLVKFEGLFYMLLYIDYRSRILKIDYIFHLT